MLLRSSKLAPLVAAAAGTLQHSAGAPVAAAAAQRAFSNAAAPAAAAAASPSADSKAKQTPGFKMGSAYRSRMDRAARAGMDGPDPATAYLRLRSSAVTYDGSSALPRLARTWKSPTQLVIDVLKSGPKTRAQIYFAINRGRMPSEAEMEAERAAEAARPRTPKRVNLLTQHPKPPPTSYEVARVKAAGIKAAAAASKVDETPLPYPEGILRNPTHLTRVLQAMTRGRRVWARPFSSVQEHYGAAEAAATQAIIARVEEKVVADKKAAALAAGATEAVAHHEAQNLRAPRRLIGPQSGHKNPGFDSQYVYVLREWADAEFAKRGPVMQGQFRGKMRRREWRRRDAVAAAEAAGTPAPALRPVKPTMRALRKAERAEAEVKRKLKERLAIKKFREQAFAPPPQPKKKGGKAAAAATTQA